MKCLPNLFTKSFFYKKNEKKTTLSHPSPPARRDPCWRAFTRGLQKQLFLAKNNPETGSKCTYVGKWSIHSTCALIAP